MVVGVLEGAVHDVGDGLEAAVRMPRRALRLPRRVLDLAHLVHVDEGVEVGEVDAVEGAADREPLALVALRGGGDAADAALGDAGRSGSAPRGGFGEPRQNGQIGNGDGGHNALLGVS